MNTTLYAARLGLQRGWIEIMQILKNPQDLGFNIFMTALFAAVLFFQRNNIVEGTNISLATMTLPSIVGMLIALGGYMGVASALAYEREDGTLLRAKAIPKGMIGYLIGKIISLAFYTIMLIVLLLIPGLLLVPSYVNTLSDWMLLIGVVVLGLLATLPWA
jgi:ABC-2 type transport system permease protein